MANDLIAKSIHDEIDRLEKQLQVLRSASHLVNGKSHNKPRAAKKRTLSADARKRIAAAQRKRWAKQKRGEKKAA